MEEINLIFANKLQELRKERNAKQETLAKELKISQQAYSKLERGASNFTMITIKKICTFFEISISTFLNTGSQTKFTNSPQANTQNSFNNEITLVNELIKSKDEIISSQKELIAQLKQSLELTKKK